MACSQLIFGEFLQNILWIFKKPFIVVYLEEELVPEVLEVVVGGDQRLHRQQGQSSQPQ